MDFTDNLDNNKRSPTHKSHEKILKLNILGLIVKIWPAGDIDVKIKLNE